MSFVLLPLLISSVYCQTWRNVLKINRNVNVNPNTYYKTSVSTYSTFAAEESYSNSLSNAHETTNFKSVLINEWKTGNIGVSRVRLWFCQNGVCPKYATFNASSWDGWLTTSNIYSSSWTDLSTSSNVVEQGIYPSLFTDRFFYIWKSMAGCDADIAWFVLSTWDFCQHEWGEGNNIPGIFWATGNTVAALGAGSTEGDAFIIQFLTDFQPPTSNPTSVPTNNPTFIPTNNPTFIPTSSPTFIPTFNPTTFNPTTTEPSTNIPTKFPSIQTHEPATSNSSTTNPTDTPTNEKQIDQMTTDVGNVDESNITLTKKSGNLTVIILVIVAIMLVILLVGILLFYFKPWTKIVNKEKLEMNIRNVEMDEITHNSATASDDDIVAVINETDMGPVHTKPDDEIVTQVNQKLTYIGNNERSDEDLIVLVNKTDIGFAIDNADVVAPFNKINSISNADDLDEVINNNKYTAGANETGDSDNEEMIVTGSHEDTMGIEANKIGEDEGVNYKLNKNGAKEVKLWLDSIGFDMYYDKLIQHGFDSMESIQEITNDDLNHIGITLRGHQLKLMKYIKTSKTQR